LLVPAAVFHESGAREAAITAEKAVDFGPGRLKGAA
jgi:hypothetical protein